MEDPKAKLNEVQQKATDENNKLRIAIETITQTAEGQYFFFKLMKRCCFHNSTIVGDQTTGEINVHATLFNEATRRLYLDFRRYIPTAIRQKIEGKGDQER